MTCLTFRATIERRSTPLPTPPRYEGPSRSARVTAQVAKNGWWVVPAIALAWPALDVVFLAFVSVVLAGSAAIAAVVDERSNDRADGADQPFSRRVALFLVLTLLSSALGLGHLPFSRVPDDVRSAATLVLGGGYLLRTLAMGTNRFFSSAILLQIERRHAVCDKGPYRLVRHPGYLSALVIVLAIPLAVGSLIGLAPALLAAIEILRRTRLEDRLLHEALAGYPGYAKRVRWRVVPLVY